MTTIYIDESGHSGDMVDSGAGYDFKRQPYFALAGVGLQDEEEWTNASRRCAIAIAFPQANPVPDRWYPGRSSPRP